MDRDPGIRAGCLSSAAYGPEAALTPLIPLGAAGTAYITYSKVLLLKGNRRIVAVVQQTPSYLFLANILNELGNVVASIFQSQRRISLLQKTWRWAPANHSKKEANNAKCSGETDD